MGASLSRATSGGSSRTMSVFSVITPWYDVSIHGLCLFTVESEREREREKCEISVSTWWNHIFSSASCPDRIYFTLTYRQSKCRAAATLALFICTVHFVLGKAPPASFCTNHSHFASLPCYLAQCRSLISDHRCAASRTSCPRPSQKEVHELRAWLSPIIELRPPGLCATPCWSTCHFFTILVQRKTISIFWIRLSEWNSFLSYLSSLILINGTVGS